MRKIGILGAHGSREEHEKIMSRLGCEICFLRTQADFFEIDGIILPGGESTSFGRLIHWSGIESSLRACILEKKIPVLGTCAGAILLAFAGSEYSLGAIDIEVQRNAYGRQVDSFSESLYLINDPVPFHSVFIRAPQIVRVGENVEVLAKYNEQPVLVRENNVLACTFHPELTMDDRVHRIFMDMIDKYSE